MREDLKQILSEFDCGPLSDEDVIDKFYERVLQQAESWDNLKDAVEFFMFDKRE